MNGYQGGAQILQAGETWDVHCTYDVTVDGDSDLKSWDGYYHAADGSYPEVGAATLRLPDGSEGSIIITLATDTPQQGMFQGSGPAPGSTGES